MGIIGDVNRNEPATISDTVNTASRIEGLTKLYGARILISDDSLETIQHQEKYHFRHLGKVQVKGKSEAVGVFECFDGDAEEIIEKKIRTLSNFEEGLERFLSREFPSATALFDQVLKMDPEDQVARYFINKSAKYTIEGVPDDWTGLEKLNIK
jgi:hypothetical protein